PTFIFWLIKMESRIQEALRYIDDFPDAKIATMARESGVPRSRLRHRREGRPPRAGIPATNTKLAEPEEKALRRYIDRLDRINLAVSAEFLLLMLQILSCVSGLADLRRQILLLLARSGL